MTGAHGWLAAGFVAPPDLAVPYGHRLRPAGPGDLARLVMAVPAPDAGGAERRLTSWLREMHARAGFTYLLVDADETAVLGGVRVRPDGATWCIVEQCRGTDLAAAFDALVPGWVAAHWPAVPVER